MSGGGSGILARQETGVSQGTAERDPPYHVMLRADLYDNDRPGEALIKPAGWRSQRMEVVERQGLAKSQFSSDSTYFSVYQFQPGS